MINQNEIKNLVSEVIKRKDNENFSEEMEQFLQAYAVEYYNKGWAEGKVGLANKVFQRN